MREYARQRGLRRLMIPVPALTPRLSSLWLGLVTPLYARVGRILIDSLRHSTVLRDHSASAVFHVRPRGVREAIASALANEESEFAQTRWSDASSVLGFARQWGGVRFGNRLVDSRSHPGRCPRRRRPFAPMPASVERPAGTTATGSGALRGWLDPVGRRCRDASRPSRPCHDLRPGDVVDCWRVEALEPGRRLRVSRRRCGCRAGPGSSSKSGQTATVPLSAQTAVYDPAGPGRTGLLVRAVSHPRTHLRRHAAQHCRGRGSS